MKKILLSIIAVFAFCVVGFAQNEDMTKTVATQLTDQMTTKYGLDKKQAKKVQKLNEEMTSQLFVMLSESSADSPDMRRGPRGNGQGRGMGEGGPRRMHPHGKRQEGERPDFNGEAPDFNGERPDFNGERPEGPRPEMTDTINASGQEMNGRGPRPGMRGRGHRPDFENDSTLTEEQKAQIRERRKARDEARAAHEEKARKIKADYEAGLKEVLTDEQFAMYLEDQKKEQQRP